MWKKTQTAPFHSSSIKGLIWTVMNETTGSWDLLARPGHRWFDSHHWVPFVDHVRDTSNTWVKAHWSDCSKKLGGWHDCKLACEHWGSWINHHHMMVNVMTICCPLYVWRPSWIRKMGSTLMTQRGLIIVIETWLMQLIHFFTDTW
jgi:hypothetical protein